MRDASRSWGRRTAFAATLTAVVAAVLPVPMAQAAATASPEGELLVVAVNAKQRDLHEGRLTQLANGLVGRTPHAPDAILVGEIIKSNAVRLRDKLNAALADDVADYQLVGITTNSELPTTSNIKVKILLNTVTMKYDQNVYWADVCAAERTYQLITAREILAGGSLGREVAVAGVHFAPSFNNGGSTECKAQNAVEARRRMAQHADSGIMGDFNRRATNGYYECNPDEVGALEPWYEAMTGPSTADGRTYRDTVRAAHFGGPTMPQQWSFEAETTETLCDNSVNYKRSRLDYIFVSDEMTPMSAGTDQGWGSGPPGDPACAPSPDCKYSDHRFVWSQVGTSTHTTTPPRPTDLAVGPTAERRLDLTWTAADGATAYEVYRYDDGLAARTWKHLGATTAPAYSDQDAALEEATTYHYRVVATAGASRSRPSLSASGTTLAPTPNQAPVVTITGPTDTTIEPEVGTQSATFDLAATATDDAGEPTWTWSENSEIIAWSATTTVTRSAGVHTFVVTATDAEGATATASVEVTVAANVAPTVTITDPEDELVTVTADDSGFAQVPLAATANDEHPEALLWTWTVASVDAAARIDPADSPSTTAVLPLGTHELRVTAWDGRLDGLDAVTVKVEPAPPAPTYVEDVAVSETAVKGTVTNTFAATHTGDGTAQEITEVSSGGKPSQRHNLLEHGWTIDVVPGAVATLHADVSATGGEPFMFAYSVDGGAFTEAFTVSGSGARSVPLPGLADGGTVVVRVVDTARTPDDTTADTVEIDHLYVRSETTLPDAPAAPASVTVLADNSANSVRVSWGDVTGETAYEVERTAEDPAVADTWALTARVGADVLAFDDTALQWSTTYWYRVRATNSGGASGWVISSSPATTPAQPTVTPMSVSLVGTAATRPKGFWDATVTATVLDSSGAPVSDANVEYAWSAGSSMTGPCVTDAKGTCSVVSSALKRDASVTFTVIDVTAASYIYSGGATSTTVSKP